MDARAPLRRTDRRSRRPGRTSRTSRPSRSASREPRSPRPRASRSPGTVKVKLGPIALVYTGSGTFTEKDEAAHRFVVDAKGKDKRGNGTAGAKVTLRMAPSASGGTDVEVLTDLAVTGKPAQFGRGVMQDVSDKLLGQFVACLEQRLGSDSGGIVPDETVAENTVCQRPIRHGRIQAAAAPTPPPTDGVQPGLDGAADPGQDLLEAGGGGHCRGGRALVGWSVVAALIVRAPAGVRSPAPAAGSSGRR